MSIWPRAAGPGLARWQWRGPLQPGRAGVAASAANRAKVRRSLEEDSVNTRTIAIIALIIAVIVLVLLLM